MNSRSKGARGERALAEAYRAEGFSAARTPNSGGLAEKGDLVGIPGVHVEAKSAGALRILDWLEQCERDAPQGKTPALHFRLCRRGKTTGWYVVLALDDFIPLLRAAQS